MKRRTIFLLSFIAVGLLVWGIIKLYSPNTLPIKKVSINGDLHFIDKNKLQQALDPLAKQGFFSANLDKIQVVVQQLPWVAEVKVKRVWPDKIIVDIATCQPVARWNQNKLLNAYGEIFEPKENGRSLASDLPIFFGKDDQTVEMLENYQQMSKILHPLHLQIMGMKYTDGLSWQIVLNNGIKMQLGKREILQKLQRFAQAYNKLVVNHENKFPRSVDLRYGHGMAVQW